MGRWQDKYVIGLTGNIAMGKSLVRQMLQHLGAYTLDADALTHQVMAPNAPAYQPVIELFGRFILTADRQIDRNKLGAVAFSHAEALRQLENITHPIISSAIDTLVTRAKHKVVVVEAIKLIETELGGYVDAIWVVDCTPENQLQRLMKRGLSQPEAVKRIQVQNPQAEKITRASVVIKNNGKPEETWAQVQQAWGTIAQGREDSAAADQVRVVQIQPTPTPPPVQPPAAPTQAPPIAAAPPAPPAPVSAPPAPPAPVSAPPAPPAPIPPATAADMMAITSVTIKRPRPADFGKLVQVIQLATGRSVTTDDIMAAFGGKTYLMAEANNQAVGLIAFLVENLVTRVDEFVIHPQTPIEAVGKALVESMELASSDLQSEVAFIFLPESASAHRTVFATQGYEEIRIEDIRIPAWREAVAESKPADTIVLTKRLREKLILKPI